MLKKLGTMDENSMIIRRMLCWDFEKSEAEARAHEGFWLLKILMDSHGLEEDKLMADYHSGVVLYKCTIFFF